MPLTPGANVPVPTTALRAVLSWDDAPGTLEIDASALLLDASGLVRDDADLVFYNQPRHASGAVRHADAAVEVDLRAMEPDVGRVVLAASADGGTFGQVAGLTLRIDGPSGEITRFPITAAGETALIAGELYRRGDGWKFRAVGQGYDHGLAALATDFGITVDEEPEPAPVRDDVPPTEPERPGLPSAIPATDPPAAPEWPAHLAPLPFTQAPAPVDHRLENRTRLVADTLARHGAGEVRARVVLVLDASGSMSTAYIDGVIGRIAARVAPVAAHLDIGVVPVWKFADTAARLPDLHVDGIADWVRGLDYHGVGLRNDEPAAIRAVLEFVAPDAPTLVVFVADSDVRRHVETSVLLRAASTKPVFWQFVGIGHADFTRYSKLDTMRLRAIDNCGFVTVSEPDRIDDRRFYDLLLGEFPRWLASARARRII